MSRSKWDLLMDRYQFHKYYEHLVVLSYQQVVNKVLHENFYSPDVKYVTQYDVFIRILDGRSDVMATMISGTNRTLSYLVPAVIRSPRVTLVFCPSVRRIEGRVKRLKELNIPAIMIHSQMSIEDQIEAVEGYLLDCKKAILIYMTPDQVFFDHFKKLYYFLEQSNGLAYLVLDESHNEHQWRLNDRQEYIELGKIRTGAIQWIVLACSTQNDIMLRLRKLLSLETCDTPLEFDSNSTSNVDRKFSFYDVITYNDEVSNEGLKKFILDALEDHPNFKLNRSRGLIFCKTGEMADKIATDLQKLGVEINSFHPGLKKDVRERAYKGFYLGDLQLLAVTSSIGRVLKCSRIRLIIHWGLPSNMKTYLEETALARGYRGMLARCRIYVTNEALSYYNEERESDLKASLENELGNLRNSNAKIRLELYMLTSQVKDYCLYENCRHQFLHNCNHLQVLYCQNMCDVCKSNEKKFKVERMKIRKEINSEGVSHFIKKFENKLKQKILLKTVMDDVLNLTIMFDELFEMTETRSLTSKDTKKDRDRFLLQSLFSEIFPYQARKCHNWLKYYS